MKRGAALFLGLLFLLSGVDGRPSAADDEERMTRERLDMVKEQIEARGIKDKRVLKAMREVPRHLFVPENMANFAYADGPLPIGSGQTISQPYVVALMTQLADIQEGEKVLEIGTGSGYQAAVLAKLTSRVDTIEILPALAHRARIVLDALGCTQVKTKIGDGYLGWPEEAPFDAIVVTAAPDHVPRPLVDQLAEGGVMVIPVGASSRPQELKRLRKKEGRIIEEKVVPVLFVPLIHEDGRVE